PRLPPHVAGLAEQRLGLAEEPLRIAERTAEHLGEPARPQRLGETRCVAELAEDPDRLAEIPTGSDQIAVRLLDRAEHPQRFTVDDTIARRDGVGEQLPPEHE